MPNSTLEAIEISLKEARKMVDLGRSLERLEMNPDFQKVIRDGYFRDEAVKLVHARVQPNLQLPQQQAWLVSRMDAIGALSQYFENLRNDAGLAAKALEDGTKTQAELLTEGAE
jgi:hypothetical protein